jgi:hypothetical protein
MVIILILVLVHYGLVLLQEEPQVLNVQVHQLPELLIVLEEELCRLEITFGFLLVHGYQDKQPPFQFQSQQEAP